MKGGLSLESTETAQSVKDGVSVFENNSVGSFNPSLNYISKVAAVITSEQLKLLMASKGSSEIDVVLADISTPSWTNGWTRFPSKGN